MASPRTSAGTPAGSSCCSSPSLPFRSGLTTEHAVGAALGRADAADRLVDDIETRFRRVHERLEAARAPRPRIAVIEWLDPVYVAGHWTPELVRRAGGVDVLAEPGAHSVRIGVE